MEIITEKLGKRFNLNWIFRDRSIHFTAGNSYAVIGPNGSGKSTFLQVLAGFTPPSEGSITYLFNSKPVHPDEIFRFISISSPYLELIEEFTLLEMVQFHFRFKVPKKGTLSGDIIHSAGLQKSEHKEIRFFSSGMKQRLKLALAFFSDTPILLLDEPTSNLDIQGIQWYRQEIKNQLRDRVVIVASNQDYEYDFCGQEIRMH